MKTAPDGPRRSQGPHPVEPVLVSLAEKPHHLESIFASLDPFLAEALGEVAASA
jgi:hypothetical protein